MKSFSSKNLILFWTALFVFGLCLGFLPSSVRAMHSWSLNLSLQEGEEEIQSKVGSELERYEMTGGQFIEGEGYEIAMGQLLEMFLPNQIPVVHVHADFKAKGFTTFMEPPFGPSDDKDGFIFSMWAPWTDPCEDIGALKSNWGVGVKKWPPMPDPVSGVPHLFSNSILMQGAGLFNGVAVPGALSDQEPDWYNWDQYQDQYFHIEIDLDGSTEEGVARLRITDPDGGVYESSEHYLPGMQLRDGVSIRLGAESQGVPSYEGVVLKDLNVTMENGYSPSRRPTDPFDPEEACEDYESDYDDPDNPYDTCACFSYTDPTGAPSCEDQPPKGDPKKASILDQFLFTFNTSSLQWLWDFVDMFDEMKETNSELMPEPEISVETAPPAPRTGEDVAGIANVMNFRSRVSNLYFAWCLVDTNNGSEIAYSANNILAGGEDYPEQYQGSNLDWLGGGCCAAITRTPEEGKDVDNDGMDDRWEEQHFIGKPIPNTDPVRYYNTIDDVSPYDDPDLDGYIADRFKNDDGKKLTGIPFLVANIGGAEVRFLPGADDGGEVAFLTNVEEYILDTDPMNGDTDADGYSDEMDYIGVGQMQFPFEVKKPAGINGFYDLSVTAIGISQNKKSAIVNAKHRMFIGNDSDPQASLLSDRSVMPMDDSYPMKLYTTIVNSDNAEKDMNYEWYFNGENICDEISPESCGMGQSDVVIGDSGIPVNSIPAPDGSEYDFKVVVTSGDGSGKTEASLSVPLTNALSLTTAGCAGQEEEFTTIAPGDENPLMVCVSGLEAVLSGSSPDIYNFIWSVDGHTDNSASGLGKTNYPLQTEKDPGEKVSLMLRVKEASSVTNEVLAESIFEVVGPDVQIVEPAELFRSNDGLADEESSQFVQVSPGGSIDFSAAIMNFVSDVGYEVAWNIDGKNYLSEITNEDVTNFSFNVPGSWQIGEVHTLLVRASSFDTSNPEEASDSISLLVDPNPAQPGITQGFFGNFAAAFTYVPKVFQGVLQYSAIFAVAFFVLVYFYPKYVRNRWNKKSFSANKGSVNDNMRFANGKEEKKLAQNLNRKRRSFE